MSKIWWKTNEDQGYSNSLLSSYEHGSVKEQVICIICAFESGTGLIQDLDRHERHENLLSSQQCSLKRAFRGWT